MRCEQCKIVPLCEVKTPLEYALTIESLNQSIRAGQLEMVYQTCPLEDIRKDGKFFAPKMFHQFRCTKCGTIYGLFINTTCGGEIKINDKIFNPADFPDADKKEEE